MKMKRLKTKDITKLSEADLVERANNLRSELSVLRSKAARGTLKKELGEIKTVRRNVARVLTVMNAKKSERQAVPIKEESTEEKSEVSE